MKTFIVFCVGCVAVFFTACGSIRTYGISSMAVYDAEKKVFMTLDKQKSDGGVLVVLPTDYVVYTPDKKLLLKRLSAPTEYSDALFSDVRYLGADFRLVEYQDDGYFNEGRTTFILFDKKNSVPVLSFSFDRDEGANKVKKDDVDKYLKDPDIVAQSKVAPKKGVRAEAPRMYLFKRGF